MLWFLLGISFDTWNPLYSRIQAVNIVHTVRPHPTVITLSDTYQPPLPHISLRHMKSELERYWHFDEIFLLQIIKKIFTLMIQFLKKLSRKDWFHLLLGESPLLVLTFHSSGDIIKSLSTTTGPGSHRHLFLCSPVYTLHKTTVLTAFNGFLV